MKHYKSLAWMMAIAIASTTMTACGSDSNETEKSFATDPVEQTRFFVCEAGSETRSATIDTLFTEDDIEWFNVSTREVRFKNQDEQLFNKLMKNYRKEGLEFHLGGDVLFEVSRFVSDFDSRVFTDLVLYYSMIGEDEGKLLSARLLPPAVHRRRAHPGKHQKERPAVGDVHEIS